MIAISNLRGNVRRLNVESSPTLEVILRLGVCFSFFE